MAMLGEMRNFMESLKSERCTAPGVSDGEREKCDFSILGCIYRSPGTEKWFRPVDEVCGPPLQLSIAELLETVHRIYIKPYSAGKHKTCTPVPALCAALKEVVANMKSPLTEEHRKTLAGRKEAMGKYDFDVPKRPSMARIFEGFDISCLYSEEQSPCYLASREYVAGHSHRIFATKRREDADILSTSRPYFVSPQKRARLSSDSAAYRP